MIATKKSTIRQSVVTLLRRAGHSPTESVRLWDEVYSVQYDRAKAGHTHIFIIGEYQFSFTKFDSEPVIDGNPVQSAQEGMFPIPILVTALVISFCFVSIIIINLLVH